MKFCYGYPDFPDASKSIEELSVPDECMKAMKRVGIQYVGDMLDVYARLPGHGFRMSLKCYSLVFREIIVLSPTFRGFHPRKRRI